MRFKSADGKEFKGKPSQIGAAQDFLDREGVETYTGWVSFTMGVDRDGYAEYVVGGLGMGKSAFEVKDADAVDMGLMIDQLLVRGEYDPNDLVVEDDFIRKGLEEDGYVVLQRGRLVYGTAKWTASHPKSWSGYDGEYTSLAFADSKYWRIIHRCDGTDSLEEVDDVRQDIIGWES